MVECWIKTSKKSTFVTVTNRGEEHRLHYHIILELMMKGNHSGQ